MLQIGTVTEYEADFEEMCTKILGLLDYFVLEMFILGLKEPIQKEVIKGKPRDVQEPFDLALLVEGTTRSKGFSYKHNKSCGGTSSYQNTKELPFVSKNPTVNTTNGNKLVFTKRGEVS